MAMPMPTAAAVIFHTALRSWWEKYSWPSERMELLTRLSMTESKAMQLSNWRWERLPPTVREFVLQHATSGKPLDYLRDDWG
jgi:hypothetical protein